MNMYDIPAIPSVMHTGSSKAIEEESMKAKQNRNRGGKSMKAIKKTALAAAVAALRRIGREMDLGRRGVRRADGVGPEARGAEVVLGHLRGRRVGRGAGAERAVAIVSGRRVDLIP